LRFDRPEYPLGFRAIAVKASSSLATKRADLVVDFLDGVGMRKLTAGGFRELASRSAALAPRLAAVLEGGYDPRTLPTLVRAALEGFRE